MASAFLTGVLSNILANLGTSAILNMASYFGGTAELSKLHLTMRMIQARLSDAERRGEGEGEEAVRLWLQGLKRILCRLEDLLEDAAMAGAAEDDQISESGRRTKRLCTWIPSSSSFNINIQLAQEAKDIMKELNDIRFLVSLLQLRELPMKERPVVDLTSNISRETHSFIIKEYVIGRDEDKSMIVAMLLDSDLGKENVSVIPIVGFGGLGKTTLAQLVFNDEEVQEHFELKCWVCISDTSSFRELAGKIFASITGSDYHQLTLEHIQSRLRQVVDKKRYLLVFDDIWEEDKKGWLELSSILCGGKRGSKIIVTTRSKVVAKNMGTVEPHELEGLPEDKSWGLFRSLAFKPGQEQGNPNMASIGREIVEKCANVPLAIKNIACLLSSMDTETEWEAFKDKDLAMIDQDYGSSVLLTLKLSYDRLAPQLKQCFAYCSLFPKDHELSKHDLIYLWMAQGFLGPSSEHQCLEDVGHGIFMQLARRCFFQDFGFDEYGEIIRCKMHDIVHDLAQLATGGESLLVDGPTAQHNSDNILHVSFRSSLTETPPWLLASKQMRSYIHLHENNDLRNLGELFSSLRRLRALGLGRSDCNSLPHSLGELKHLRYLKLGMRIKSIPECITRLQNLQTLDLQECYELEELPRGLSKLIKLRHLHFYYCAKVSDMPPGFGQLTSLRFLDKFVVRESNGLDALTNLIHLTGNLSIEFRERCGNGVSEIKVGILKHTTLANLELQGSFGEEDELELSCLQPPQSLKRLVVFLWKGVRFPSWGMDEDPCLLPNLVKVEITDCGRCQHLPPLSRLPHLKTLILIRLGAMEYIEMDTDAASSAAAPAIFFPFLESLYLHGLPELKGWSRAAQELLPRPFFPRLSELNIQECPKLKSMPLVPSLKSLEAGEIHGKLIKHLVRAEQELESGSGLPTTFPAHSPYLSTLLELDIGSVPELESLSIISLCSLEYLGIMECQDLINMTVGSPTLSLQILVIRDCKKLRDISIAPQHLAVHEASIEYCRELESQSGLGCFTGLEELRLIELPNLRSLPESIGQLTQLQILVLRQISSLMEILPESIGHLTRLATLYLNNLPKLRALPESIGHLTQLEILDLEELPNLRALPESIGHLTQLQTLRIDKCIELRELPESFCNLTSLERLNIWGCPELKRRCETPDGQYWPLIQHIPHLSTRDYGRYQNTPT